MSLFRNKKFSKFFHSCPELSGTGFQDFGKPLKALTHLKGLEIETCNFPSTQ